MHCLTNEPVLFVCVPLPLLSAVDQGRECAHDATACIKLD